MILAVLAVLVPLIDVADQLDVHVDARQLRYAIHTSGHRTAGATSSPEVEPPCVAPSGDDHPVMPSFSPDAPDDNNYGIPAHWLELAQCESGNWHDGGAWFSGPIRWDWGKPGVERPPWGTDLHHGGLQWAPSTWSWLAPQVLDDPPAFAYDATPEQEVAVAERYVELERRAGRGGWGPWPTCAPMVGLPT